MTPIPLNTKTDGLALSISYMDATQGWIPTIDEAVSYIPVKLNDNGIFGYGYDGSSFSISNTVSNVGVISADVTGVGTARYYLAACEYGGDKAIFGYGSTASQFFTNQFSIQCWSSSHRYDWRRNSSKWFRCGNLWW